jgi:acetoacetyl-CoA synthetase
VLAFHSRTLAEALRDRFGRATVPSDRQALQGGAAAYDDYRWDRYDGPVTFFRARVRLPVVTSLLLAWRRVVPHLRVVDVPGVHHDLLSAQHAAPLAQRVAEALRAAPRARTGTR